MPAKAQKINPDLLKERQKASFKTEELAVWWNGGQKKLENKRFLGKYYGNRGVTVAQSGKMIRDYSRENH